MSNEGLPKFTRYQTDELVSYVATTPGTIFDIEGKKIQVQPGQLIETENGEGEDGKFVIRGIAGTTLAELGLLTDELRAHLKGAVEFS